jgi:hypothetical protein
MYNDDPLRQPGPATPTRSYIPKRWRKKATHARTHTLESDKGKYYLLRVSLFPDHLITLLTYLETGLTCQNGAFAMALVRSERCLV